MNRGDPLMYQMVYCRCSFIFVLDATAMVFNTTNNVTNMKPKGSPFITWTRTPRFVFFRGIHPEGCLPAAIGLSRVILEGGPTSKRAGRRASPSVNRPVVVTLMTINVVRGTIIASWGTCTFDGTVLFSMPGALTIHHSR